MNVTRALAEFAHGITYEALPETLRAQALASLTDTLMVARAGGGLPHIASTIAMLTAQERGSARLWTTGARVSPRTAAFCNALCAAALDYDSVVGTVHADLVVWPALLALCGVVPVSGEQLIAAYAAGAEIAARIGAALSGDNPGWSATPISGPFGVAAASSLLVGSDVTGTVQAMGIALSQTAGTQQGHVEQVLSKNAQPAFAASAGLFAAQLAHAGISGPAEPLEGKFGFGSVYMPLDRDRLLSGLGEDWLILDTALKKFPVCAVSHPVIQTIIDLAHAQNLTPDDIDRIYVIITPTMDRLVGGAFVPTDNPLVTAQFSLRYGIARALLSRDLRIAHLSADAVLDGAVAELAGKVTLDVDPARKGASGPADVMLLLRDGRRLQVIADTMPGSADRPLTAQELDAKYHDCCGSSGQAVQHWVAVLPAARDVERSWTKVRLFEGDQNTEE